MFAPGDSKKEIRIQIINNNLIEPFKYFKLIIDKVSIENFNLVKNEQIIYIQDDDCKFLILFFFGAIYIFLKMVNQVQLPDQFLI